MPLEVSAADGATRPMAERGNARAGHAPATGASGSDLSRSDQSSAAGGMTGRRQPGERLVLRALNAGLESFEILRSSGVTRKTARIADQAAASSWYARGPWHELEPACDPGGAPERGEAILLASFGATFLARARETVIPLLARGRGDRDRGLAAAVGELRELLQGGLAGLGVKHGVDGPGAVIVTPPGAESTAFNYAEGRYMGLHIDQHDGLPLDRRDEARRLCLVNIGWQHRYVHIYPYHLLDLCHAVGVSPRVGDQDPRPRGVTARYFAAQQDAEILRIRIEPGSGYLINAQDLEHDGAVPEGNVPAVALHSLGTWPVRRA